VRQNEHSHVTIWIALILILSAFAALDVGALAWSASAISGLQLAAELLTFFTVMAGAVATVWWMRTHRL
jgi:hypothetical protein